MDASSLDVFKVGWGVEKPDVVKDIPAHSRGIELNDL